MRFHRFIPTAALACVACASNDGGNATMSAASVAIAPNALVLVVGQSGAVNAHALSTNGDTLPGNTFTWSTSNPAVVTVSSAGLATAHAAGTAVIRGTSGSAIGNATVTVITPAAVTLLVTNGTCVGTQWIPWTSSRFLARNRARRRDCGDLHLAASLRSRSA